MNQKSSMKATQLIQLSDLSHQDVANLHGTEDAKLRVLKKLSLNKVKLGNASGAENGQGAGELMHIEEGEPGKLQILVDVPKRPVQQLRVNLQQRPASELKQGHHSKARKLVSGEERLNADGTVPRQSQNVVQGRPLQTPQSKLSSQQSMFFSKSRNSSQTKNRFVRTESHYNVSSRTVQRPKSQLNSRTYATREFLQRQSQPELVQSDSQLSNDLAPFVPGFLSKVEHAKELDKKSFRIFSKHLQSQANLQFSSQVKKPNLSILTQPFFPQLPATTKDCQQYEQMQMPHQGQGPSVQNASLEGSVLPQNLERQASNPLSRHPRKGSNGDLRGEIFSGQEDTQLFFFSPQSSVNDLQAQCGSQQANLPTRPQRTTSFAEGPPVHRKASMPGYQLAGNRVGYRRPDQPQSTHFQPYNSSLKHNRHGSRLGRKRMSQPTDGFQSMAGPSASPFKLRRATKQQADADAGYLSSLTSNLRKVVHATRVMDLGKPVLGGQGTVEPLAGSSLPKSPALPGKRVEHESVVVSSAPYFDQRVLAGYSSRASAETGEQQPEHPADRAMVESDFISSILYEHHTRNQPNFAEVGLLQGNETQHVPSPHSKHWHSTAMSLSEVSDAHLIQMMREKLRQLRTQKEACKRRTSIVEQAIEALDPANQGKMPRFKDGDVNTAEEKNRQTTQQSISGGPSLQESTDRKSLKKSERKYIQVARPSQEQKVVELNQPKLQLTMATPLAMEIIDQKVPTEVSFSVKENEVNPMCSSFSRSVVKSFQQHQSSQPNSALASPTEQCTRPSMPTHFKSSKPEQTRGPEAVTSAVPARFHSRAKNSQHPSTPFMRSESSSYIIQSTERVSEEKKEVSLKLSFRDSGEQSGKAEQEVSSESLSGQEKPETQYSELSLSSNNSYIRNLGIEMEKQQNRKEEALERRAAIAVDLFNPGARRQRRDDGASLLRSCLQSAPSGEKKPFATRVKRPSLLETAKQFDHPLPPHQRSKLQISDSYLSEPRTFRHTFTNYFFWNLEQMFGQIFTNKQFYKEKVCKKIFNHRVMRCLLQVAKEFKFSSLYKRMQRLPLHNPAAVVTKLIAVHDLDFTKILDPDMQQKQAKHSKFVLADELQQSRLAQVRNSAEYKIEKYLQTKQKTLLLDRSIYRHELDDDLKVAFRLRNTALLAYRSSRPEKELRKEAMLKNEQSYESHARCLDIVLSKECDEIMFIFVNDPELIEQATEKVSLFNVRTIAEVLGVSSEVEWTDAADRAKEFQRQLREVTVRTNIKGFIESLSRFNHSQFYFRELSQKKYVRLKRNLRSSLEEKLSSIEPRIVPSTFRYRMAWRLDAVLKHANAEFADRRFGPIAAYYRHQSFNSSLPAFEQRIVDRQTAQGTPEPFKSYFVSHLLGQNSLARFNDLIFNLRHTNILFQLHNPDNNVLVHVLEEKLQVYCYKHYHSAWKERKPALTELEFNEAPRRSLTLEGLPQASQVAHDLFAHTNFLACTQADKKPLQSEDFDQFKSKPRQVRRYKRVGALDHFSPARCEIMIMDVLQEQVVQAKDVHGPYYKEVQVLPGSHMQALKNFGYKCKFVRDPLFPACSMELFKPTLQDKALEKLLRWEDQMRLPRQKTRFVARDSSIVDQWNARPEERAAEDSHVPSKELKAVQAPDFDTDESLKGLDFADLKSEQSDPDHEQAEESQVLSGRQRAVPQPNPKVRDRIRHLTKHAETTQQQSALSYYEQLWSKQNKKLFNKTYKRKGFQVVSAGDLIEKSNAMFKRTSLHNLAKYTLSNTLYEVNHDNLEQLITLRKALNYFHEVKKRSTQVAELDTFLESRKGALFTSLVRQETRRQEQLGRAIEEVIVVPEGQAKNQTGMRETSEIHQPNFKMRDLEELEGDIDRIAKRYTDLQLLDVYEYNKQFVGAQEKLEPETELKILRYLKEEGRKAHASEKVALKRKLQLLDSLKRAARHKKCKKHSEYLRKMHRLMGNLRLSKKLQALANMHQLRLNLELPTRRRVSRVFSRLELEQIAQRKIVYSDEFKGRLYEVVEARRVTHMQELLQRHFISAENTRNEEGNSLLALAVIQKDVPMVRLLLSNHMSPNTQNNEGNTPLHYAVRQRSRKITDMLMEYGAREDIPNYEDKVAWELLLG